MVFMMLLMMFIFLCWELTFIDFISPSGGESSEPQLEKLFAMGPIDKAGPVMPPIAAFDHLSVVFLQ